MKLKADLDNADKEKLQIALETIQLQLDREGIPLCPLCNRRTDALAGHIEITHYTYGGQQKKANEVMESSAQSGYGRTEGYQLVDVQCKK